MAESVNQVTIRGRLGKDPDVRTVGANSTSLAKLSIATTEHKKRKDGDGFDKETEWHTVVLWGDKAEKCRSLKKGQLVHVEGKLKTRTWQPDEGPKRYFTEVVANGSFSVLAYADEGISQGSDPRDDDQGQQRQNGGQSSSRSNGPPHPAESAGGGQAPSQGSRGGNDSRSRDDFPF